MEPFTCPRCGHRSTFDPLIGPAICPRCGYTPPKDHRSVIEPPKKPHTQKPPRHVRQQLKIQQPLLDELLAYWRGTHTPDWVFRLPTSKEAYALFQEYQQALGEGVRLKEGGFPAYVRCYVPERKAVLGFISAYLLLRQGQRGKAAQHLQELTRLYPDFPDPWIWLSATTDDLAKRIDYLENAVLLEPAHPLARDALAIAQGRVALGKGRPGGGTGRQVMVANCPRCGGTLNYEPGAKEVECQHCGHSLQLQETSLIDEDARLVGDLQLRRRLRGQPWTEARQVAGCQACGAQLTMARYLAKQCLFCGSTMVLVGDSHQTLEQPDGFLPFKLDEQRAAAAIQRVGRSAGVRLKAWWSGGEQEIQGVEAIYLPFWVFDGFVEVRKPLVSPFDPGSGPGRPYPGREQAMFGSFTDGAWMSRQQDRPPSQGKPTMGKQVFMFDNLVFSAMDFPPAWFLKQILPFELAALVPYEPRLLANWPAALYHRDVEVVAREAYNLMLAEAVWRKKWQMLSSPSDVIQLRRTFQVTAVTYQLVLLPVWVALVQRDRERRLALVNGQTGQAALSSPLRSGSSQVSS